MKLKIGLVCLLAVLSLAGCRGMGVPFNSIEGSGTMVSEKRVVQDIQGVTLATVGELDIQLGEEESLYMEMEDNLLPHIVITVEDGMLTIQQKKNVTIVPSLPVRYVLTVKQLDALIASGSGNVSAPVLQAKAFEIAINNRGNIHLAGLTADTLEVEINSVGSLQIDQGSVNQQSVILNSAGNYDAENLYSVNAKVQVNSSGNARLWVKHRLDAKLGSSGSVYCYGDPAILKEISASGDVIPLGEK